MPTLTATDVVDGLVALVILLYALEDFRRGALFGLLDLGGFVSALLVALLAFAPLSGFLVEQFEIPYAVAKPVAFGLAWIGTDLVFALTLRRLFTRPARAVARYRLGRLLGAATGLVRGALVAALAMAVALALLLPDATARAIRDSRAASYLGDQGLALQQRMAGVLGDAVEQTLGLLTIKPESGERVDLPFKVADGRVDETAETRMIELVNAERTRSGLEPLTVDPTIREVARAYSAEMFRDGFFSHVDLQGRTPFERMRQGGVRFAAAGENLALAPTVDVAHRGLMNSPGHRANIVNGRFRRVGIGVVEGGLHGKMFTQDFAD